MPLIDTEGTQATPFVLDIKVVSLANWNDDALTIVILVV